MVSIRAADGERDYSRLVNDALDSALDRQAVAEGWLARFPMSDSVGGRTSELCTVGLLPAAL